MKDNNAQVKRLTGIIVSGINSGELPASALRMTPKQISFAWSVGMRVATEVSLCLSECAIVGNKNI